MILGYFLLYEVADVEVLIYMVLQAAVEGKARKYKGFVQIIII